MATEPKASTAQEESPELAHLRFREKDLMNKASRLSAHPETNDHDIPAAKARNELALKQIRAEIKRLEKK